MINITDNTTKWSDIQNTKFTGKDNAESLTGANKDNFFMTNSPLSDGTLLVNVQPKSTQAEARATTKTVYVERAVGKVSLSKGTGTDWSNWTYTIPTSSLSSYKTDKVEIKDWCLDITNRAEYAVRSYETSWNDIKNDKTGYDYIRFRDANENHKLKGNEGDAYRTHWAKSPQYTTDLAGVTYKEDNTDVDYPASSGNEGYNYLSNASGAATDITGVGVNNSAYCFENTFTTKNMRQGNTTRVVIKAKYTPNSNFAEDITSVDADGTWYTIGNSGKVYNSESLVKLVKAALGVDDVTIGTFEAGKHDLEETSFKVNGNNLGEGQLEKLKNTIGKVTTYKEGVCFYVARIKHFGDTYTPWADENYLNNTDANKYDKEFLGRYGIVRNNWYKMTVNSFSAPGDPTVPEIPNSPDDETKYYLQTTIEIMDWAVRENGIDF